MSEKEKPKPAEAPELEPIIDPVSETPEPDVREDILEAVDRSDQPNGFIRSPREPVINGGLEPLEPLEPYSGDDYADMIGAALDPSNLMPSLMPVGVKPVVAPRKRGFTSQVSPLQFTCPYGLDGRCCGCRYLPCNELTVAVLGHVSRDYGPGGRCSAD